MRNPSGRRGTQIEVMGEYIGFWIKVVIQMDRGSRKMDGVGKLDEKQQRSLLGYVDLQARLSKHINLVVGISQVMSSIEVI